MLPLPPSSTLFPYTTLFRSARLDLHRRRLRRRSGTLSPGHLWLDGARLPLRGFAGQNLRHAPPRLRSEEHTSELQSHSDLVCRLLLEKKKTKNNQSESNK